MGRGGVDFSGRADIVGRMDRQARAARDRAPGTSRLVAMHGVSLLAASFTLATLVAMLFVPATDDEGYQAFMWADALLADPLAIAFVQKAKAVGGLLALPGVLAGWTGYLAWHKVLAGATVLLIGQAARAQGGRGWVAALVLATSPAFVAGAMQGHSNVQGALVAAVAIRLLVSGRRPALAGLALGTLPWVRSEYVVFVVAAVVAEALAGRARAVLAGVLAFPVAYALAGAAYHHDLLWLVHFPPTVAFPEAVCPEYEAIAFETWYLRDLACQATLLLPAWPLLALLSWRSSATRERTWLVTLLVTAFLLLALPFSGFAKFGHTVRYWIVLLPFAALLLDGPSAFAPAAVRNPIAPVALLLAGVAIVVAAQPGMRFAGVLLLSGFPAFHLLAARRGWRHGTAASAVLLAVGVAASLASDPPFTERLATSSSREARQVASWLAGGDRARRAGRILTNISELALSPELRQAGLDGRTRFIAGYGVLNEMHRLLDHANGQYAAAMAAVAPRLNGGAEWPCRLAATGDLTGTLLVLRRDVELRFVLPDAFFDCASDRVAAFGPFEVREGRQRSREGDCAGSDAIRDDEVTRDPCALAPAGG
jgi:hypothetical protein